MDIGVVLTQWATTYPKASTLRVLIWLAGQCLAASDEGGWTAPMSRAEILERVGVSRAESRAVFEVIEREFDLGVKVGHGRSYRVKGMAQSDQNPIRTDRNPISFTEAPDEQEPIEIRSVSESDQNPITFARMAAARKLIRIRSLSPLSGSKSDQFWPQNSKVIEIRSVLAPVCMYVKTPDPTTQESSYIQPAPPAPLDEIEPFAGFEADWLDDSEPEYGVFDAPDESEPIPEPETNIWIEKRAAALLHVAGWSGPNPSEQMRRWACERVLAKNGVQRKRAKQLAYELSLDRLEEGVDYWIYLRAKGIKVPVKGGEDALPGPGWIIGHLTEDYGINHGYAPNWRWPGVALCPECGAEHRNGEGFLCDSCTADPAAETEEDLQAVQVDLTPAPEDWWAESLREKVGTLEVGDGWLAALGQLETQLGKTTFNTWFGSCTALYYKTSSSTLAVGVPRHKLQALERRAKSQLERALQAVLGAVIKVRLEANEEVAA